MAAPVIGLYDSTHTNVVSTWAVGTVKAGQDSSVLEVNVWNNKGGATDVSDIVEATIGCKDGNGENTGDVPANKWLQALVNTTAAVDGSSNKIYTAIGGDTTCPLRAEGVAAATGDVIKGTANDGTSANSAVNYSNCKLKVSVPINSKSGDFAFKVRFQGYYV
jgi:hypothetical protein